MIIVGDCGGQFETVLKLYERVNQRYPDEKWVFVGDVVDRGPMSRQLIAWIRQMGHEVVYGNHEDMMIDWVRNEGNPHLMKYDRGDWFINGGAKTLWSYVPDLTEPEASANARQRAAAAMLEDAEWLSRRPRFLSFDDLIITHAPINRDLQDYMSYLVDPHYEFKMIWNRQPPRPRDKFQVFGHNGMHDMYKQQKMSGSCRLLPASTTHRWAT